LVALRFLKGRPLAPLLLIVARFLAFPGRLLLDALLFFAFLAGLVLDLPLSTLALLTPLRFLLLLVVFELFEFLLLAATFHLLAPLLVGLLAAT
jgi:hypothetical protein